MAAPRTREQQRREQRAHILATARTVFSEQGPDTATMSDIASAAGVARATVFNHFGSKHGLLDAIVESVLQGYVRLLDGALADKQTHTVALTRGLFEAMGSGIERDRNFFRAVFREIAKLSLGLHEGGAGQGARQIALDRMVQLLTRGQARGELTTDHDADDLATAFDGLVFGTIIHWLYGDLSEDLLSRMRRAAEIFLGPVAVQDAAGAAPLRSTGEIRR